MIVKLFRQPHVLYQEHGEDDMPNEAISICVDNGGTICLQQRDQCIVLNEQTVPELCKFLKGYKANPQGKSE